MAKSIKLKDNNYIDSTGIVHNRELLSDILDNQVVDQDTNYIRFGNGVQICWGDSKFTTNTGGVGFYEVGLTFPVPFIDKNYAISFTETEQWNTGAIATLGRAWSTNARATCFSKTSNWGFTYIAIGKWK